MSETEIYEKLIYEILMERDSETNLLYKIWRVPVGFPVTGNFVKIAPPAEIEYAKFDFMKNMWVEDIEFAERTKMEQLEQELMESNSRVDTLENVVLELLMMKASEV